MEPRVGSFAAMGAQWSLRIWDALSEPVFGGIVAEAEQRCAEFEARYSRFRPDSWLRSVEGATGTLPAPRDFVQMLELYQRFHAASGGKCTPLLGATLSDLGYDESYSLRERETVRHAPDFATAIRCLDAEHIAIDEPVSFDIGAMGKGFMVDVLAAMLAAKGIGRYLVDGSGDIVYRGNGEAIRAGLEHPDDPTKVIGVIELLDGAFCASSGNRRRWGKHHHIIDPVTLESPMQIRATWVRAASAAVADCAATTLFLAEPEPLVEEFGIEYCVLGEDLRARFSPGFTAEFF